MAFFNEFKDKFNKAAQSVSNKTKESVEITRLAGESRNITSELTSVYEQIGRTYVESNGVGYEALAPLCARVQELKDRLEEIERQKMQLKNQNRCPACGAAMPKNARFCSSCGRRMPEAEAPAEAAPTAEESQYCPSCGAMRKDENSFCAVCGHDFEGSTLPDEAPQPRKYIVLNPQDNSDEAPTDFD